MAHGGGHFSSEEQAGGFIFQGTLQNNQFSGGTLLNQSGICGPDILEKYKTAPWGWFETTGYRERFADDHSQIERVFEGPWGLRPQFIAWALGYSTNVPDPDNPRRGILKREIPVMDCEFPWLYATDYELVEGQGAWVNNYIQAKECDGRPVLINGQPVWFPKIGYLAKDLTLDRLSARVKLTFQALDFDVRTDRQADALGQGELSRCVTRDRTYSMDAIPLPRASIYFDDASAPASINGQLIPENSGRLLLPRLQLRYVWHDVPDIPDVAIEECTGKVNAVDFDGARGGRVYPPRTLLCLPPQTARYRARNGRVVHRITYLLLYQKQGWHKFPAANGQFYGVRISDTGSRDVFGLADFNQLFTQPAPLVYQ